MPVEPGGGVSTCATLGAKLAEIVLKGSNLNRSSLSWASVAASVKWPPAALFPVVVAIKPARDNSAMDKMTKATSTSIKVKPFDFLKTFKD
jgi:hypothetical protein